MFKIKTLNAISPSGLKLFPSNLYEISADEVAPDAILVRSADMHHLPIEDSVKVIGRAGAGLNNIPVDALTVRGIPVLNTPGANANAVRELVLAGMLLASRNIGQALEYVNHLELQGEALDKEIEKNKKQFVGTELLGKTLGVIGLGSVGVKVANAAIHLGMKVIGFDPTISVKRAWELSASVTEANNIDDLLKHADFVSIHVPLTAETKSMMNSARFKVMKDNAVLLNFARNGVIDQPALIAALNEKKIAAYVSDFPASELKQFPQVISLPHLGASTKEAEENCAVMIVQQARDFLENGSIINAANFPTVELPALSTGVRLTVVNANIPKMVAQISAKLADAGLNIISLVNKSRDEIAYTVIDVNQGIEKQVLTEIAAIDGVKQVRVINRLEPAK